MTFTPKQPPTQWVSSSLTYTVPWPAFWMSGPQAKNQQAVAFTASHLWWGRSREVDTPGHKVSFPACEVGVKEQLGFPPLPTQNLKMYLYMQCPPSPTFKWVHSAPSLPSSWNLLSEKKYFHCKSPGKIKSLLNDTMQTMVSKLCWVYNLLAILIATFAIGLLAIGTVWKESWNDLPSHRANRASMVERITPKYYTLFHSNVFY